MNKKGFTLIELLAVVIILGVIMTIAVPNVLSMLDRNKKDTFIEHAKTMVNQAEYTLRKDTSIDYPEKNEDAIILTLEYLNTDDISESPYNTKYSPSKSFVAIVNKTQNEGATDAVTEYKYYVHLVACTDIDCNNSEENSVNKNRGINLTVAENLNTGKDRFSLVKQGSDVNVTLGNIENDGTLTYESEIKFMIGATSVKLFNKLTEKN